MQAAHQQVDALLRKLHSADPAKDVTNLLLCEGDFIMPTLNGWLLGYPVVYLVDEANVQATADHLSSESVQRHIVMASCAALKVRLQPVSVLVWLCRHLAPCHATLVCPYLTVQTLAQTCHGCGT